MIGETITRLRGVEATDPNGDSYTDWTNPAELDIENVAVAPRVEEEVHGAGRGGVIVGYTIYAPPDVDLLFTDRVRTREGVFKIEGEPGNWRNPYSGRHWGTQISLRRVDG